MTPRVLAAVALMAGATACLLAITAHAAAGPVLEDPAGDVEGGLPGQTQPVSGWEATDLVGLDVEEKPDAFVFTVHVAGLDGRTEDAREDAPIHFIRFRLGETGYQAYVGRPVDNTNTFAGLSRQDPGSGGYRFLERLDAEQDPAAATFTVHVPRDLLRDDRGAPAGQGHVLSDLHVDARAQASRMVVLNDPVFGPLEDGPVVVTDRMPDSGGGAVTVRLGGRGAEGALSMVSDEPFRASNGGAATVRYVVAVANTGSDATVALKAEDVPAGWDVVLPEAIDLPAGATADVGVVVMTPFGHQHGGSGSFRVTATSDEGEAWIVLGIQYLDVPQPAGHHDTLYLHGHPWPFEGREVNPPLGGTNGKLTMDTLEPGAMEDPDESDDPIAGSTWNLPTTQYRWYVCLEPQLRLGLDVDAAAKGAFEAAVTTTRPLGASTLSGRLVHLGAGDAMSSCYPSQWDGRKETELATFRSDAVDLATTATFTAEVAPAPGVDRVPYEKDAALVLELVLDVENPGAYGAGGPRIVPGASLEVPLEEYHDARPAGIVDTAVPEDLDVQPQDGTRTAETQDSPGAPVALLLGALALVARRRA